MKRVSHKQHGCKDVAHKHEISKFHKLYLEVGGSQNSIDFPECAKIHGVTISTMYRWYRVIRKYHADHAAGKGYDLSYYFPRSFGKKCGGYFSGKYPHPFFTSNI